MIDSSKKEHVRNNLIEWIKSDMVGPRGGPEEVLPRRENPTQSYLSGILFPRMSGTNPEEDEREQIEVENDNGDSQEERVDLVTNLKQSSFGITCTVPRGANSILAHIEYGTYDLRPKVVKGSELAGETLVEQDGNEESKEGKAKTGGSVGEKSYVYKRTQHSETHEIRLGDPMPKPDIPLETGTKFTLKCHTKEHERGLSMSVFVVNNNIWDGDSKNEFKRCMFQPRLTLSAPGGDRIFVDSRVQGESYTEDRDGHGRRDSALFGLLFRKNSNFAIGHGCAVEWDGGDTSDRVSELRTAFIPVHIVPKIRPRRMIMKGLDMKVLFKVTDRSEYRDLLAPIADGYERWISQELEAKIETLAGEFQEAAASQIRECRASLGRMRKGIDIISTDKRAADAFSFANRAMWLQMSYGEWAQNNAERKKVDGSRPKEYSGRWRPFQLAFFLINVESITDPRSTDRSTVDLLWFATGGGKTEAYLGIIAFTMAHRRLRHDTEHMRYGTAVMMRYTLRLLTLQQFHRAATLMCGCEYIRRKDPKTWGDEPFLVGLWVGSSTTPNSLGGEYGAGEAIKSARRGNLPREHSPLQLVSCPWCGSAVNEHCYEVSGTPRQCRVYCPNRSCAFSKGGDGETNLPVLVVDEDIYRRCPSLVIGTVDKFAQITWKWETGAIFGRVNKYCQKHGFVMDELSDDCNTHTDHESFLFSECGPPRLEPPELIIQDELHLISGPLGTLTGLYETAIDILCTGYDGTRPKIIASTATTRRAGEQIRSLFNRNTSSIFPPQGIDFGHSFFAEEVPLDEDPGKAYVGVCMAARSRLTVLGRISATILRCVRRMEEGIPENDLSHKDIDQYYTLVSYFNTLKELGAASKMYDDTVPGYIQRLFSNFEDQKNVSGRYRNQPLEKVELTSRIDASRIPDILKGLERTLSGTIRPEDLLLCTNMLSVGVDISRLGVMIVNGQPKNHSEYIQATGRIGRESPGLVVTSLNALKPRDLSHYENFGYYHSTLHMNVEPVNLTPFASRARDRALFGVLVALMRLFESRLAKNDAAGRFDKNVRHVSKVLDVIRQELAGRVGNIDAQERDATLTELEQCTDRWHEWASSIDRLQYSGNQHEKAKRPEDVYYLLGNTFYTGESELVSVPNSLRDAEEAVKMWYLDDLPRHAKDAPEGET